jgi:hypothetical protein
MKKANFTTYKVLGPVSRSLADTTYNGVAIASAVGIPLADYERIILDVNLGALASDVAYTLHTSLIASAPTAGDLTAIIGASIGVLATDDDKMFVSSVMIKNVGSATGKPLYLYLKRVQATAVANLESVVIRLTDPVTQPVLPVSALSLVPAQTAYTFDV